MHTATPGGTQHTHNKPKDLWALYGAKPFMYDEIKYEGRLSSNWGSLSAPQMVRVTSRSIEASWGSLRFRSLMRTYDAPHPHGAYVQMS